MHLEVILPADETDALLLEDPTEKLEWPQPDMQGISPKKWL